MPSNRRDVARRILSDPDARRKLMVKTIQATQAREGIETSEAQAEKAYYVVTEGDVATFFDLVKFRGGKDEKDKREYGFVLALQGQSNKVRADVARRDFSIIDGSPLAYLRVAPVSHIFKSFPSLEPAFGIVRQGKASGDDSRWVREHWEVQKNSGWVPFAKGGEYSRFYQDVHLVLNWKPEHREELKASGNAFPSVDLYFKKGLTWPRRTQRGFNLRILPEGCIFADKGPAIFPAHDNQTFYLLGVANCAIAEYILHSLMSFGSWEVGVLKKLPIPQPSKEQIKIINDASKIIHDAKADWDKGNEVSTSFTEPWILREDVVDPASSATERLDYLAEYEAQQTENIQRQYAELNDHVYRLYGISDKTRATIQETLGVRPPEIIWPQMEKRDAEQKRMEHVCRLLSYLVKRVIIADEDGIVPFASTSGESSLLERIQREIEELFPHQAGTQTESQIVNELRRRVKGYRRAESIAAWLEDAFFDYHVSLYERRPVIWHIASRPTGEGAAAFGALVDYHRFDRNNMAKLRSTYLRDAINHFRREAALASQEGRPEDHLELQAKLEEATALDQQLRRVQEGEGSGEGDKRDLRILTPWKSPQQRPIGWNPDIDDGVKVNIEPLQKAGVLRIARVV